MQPLLGSERCLRFFQISFERAQFLIGQVLLVLQLREQPRRLHFALLRAQLSQLQLFFLLAPLLRQLLLHLLSLRF